MTTTPERTARRTAEIRDLTVEWAARILDAPDAEPEDNFLDLGGHSILALRMCRYAKERYGAEYDLMLLFESDLAAAADELASRIDAG